MGFLVFLPHPIQIPRGWARFLFFFLGYFRHLDGVFLVWERPGYNMVKAERLRRQDRGMRGMTIITHCFGPPQKILFYLERLETKPTDRPSNPTRCPNQSPTPKSGFA